MSSARIFRLELRLSKGKPRFQSSPPLPPPRGGSQGWLRTPLSDRALSDLSIVSGAASRECFASANPLRPLLSRRQPPMDAALRSTRPFGHHAPSCSRGACGRPGGRSAGRGGARSGRAGGLLVGPTAQAPRDRRGALGAAKLCADVFKQASDCIPVR